MSCKCTIEMMAILGLREIRTAGVKLPRTEYSWYSKRSYFPFFGTLPEVKIYFMKAKKYFILDSNNLCSGWMVWLR